MKSRFNVLLKRKPSHPLVVEIWKCWFDVLAAAFWNKKLRNSAEKSKLTALNNALKTQALKVARRFCMCVGHLPLNCTVFSKIHFFNNRSFTSSKCPVHTVVQSCTRTHWNNYMYQYFRGFGHPFGDGPLTPRVHTPFGRKTIFLRLL